MKNRIPPPLILLASGGLMWWLAGSAWALPVEIPGALPLAIIVAGCGLAIAVVAVRAFHAAETTINPLEPASATSLVRHGLFAWTRNPMYLGLALILAGWALWLESLSSVAVLALFVVFLTEFQIKPEEAALRELFGEEFAQYCREVRRWL